MAKMTWFRQRTVILGVRTCAKFHSFRGHDFTGSLTFHFAIDFWATVSKTVLPMLSVVCLSVCPVLSVTLVYCGQTVGRIKTKLVTQLGLGPGHIVLDEDPAPPPLKGHNPPIFVPCLLWPNGWMDQDGTWHGNRPQPRRPCVRWGPIPFPKRGRTPLPNFRCISIVAKPNDWMHQNATWYGATPQPRGLCVRWGPSLPPLKGGRSSQFSVHLYCRQTDGCIKMPLGMEVGLSPGDVVLDGDPAPLP